MPQLVDALCAQSGVLSEGWNTERRWYLETFDGRLAAAKQVLSVVKRPRLGTEIQLRTLAGETTEQLTSELAMPQFASQFRPGRMQLRLAQITLGRALLPRAVGQLKVLRCQCQDATGKLLAGLQLEVGRGRQPRVVLRVCPARGFERATQRVLRPFLALGLVVPLKADAAAPLLQHAGLARCAYTCKPLIRLRPQLAAAPAVAQVLSAYTHSLRANEGGIVADLDGEFLHDYRVVLRCLRAWLGDLKPCMAQPPLRALRAGLTTLNRLTGKLRDLDVLTRQLDAYLAQGDGMTPTIPLRERLATCRAQAHTELAAHLKSPVYRSFQRQWTGFLAALTAGKHPGRGSHLPIRDLVRRAIGKRRARVLAFDPALAQTNPSALHELRKNCKRLRYLLEGFALLFARGPLRLAVEELKNLQRTLGETWDLHVHLGLLTRLCAEVPGGAPLVVVLGARLCSLEAQQVVLVVAAIGHFRSPQAQRPYADLLARAA